MHPILTRYGSFFLYSFTVVLSIGVTAGLGLAAWRARRLVVDFVWLDMSLAGLVTGLIGGRIGFVWLEWAYFGERPYQILQFWRGGLTYHGVLFAGLLGGWGWSVLRKRPFSRMPIYWRHQLRLSVPLDGLLVGWMGAATAVKPLRAPFGRQFT